MAIYGDRLLSVASILLTTMCLLAATWVYMGQSFIVVGPGAILIVAIWGIYSYLRLRRLSRRYLELALNGIEPTDTTEFRRLDPSEYEGRQWRSVKTGGCLFAFALAGGLILTFAVGLIAGLVSAISDLDKPPGLHKYEVRDLIASHPKANSWVTVRGRLLHEHAYTTVQSELAIPWVATDWTPEVPVQLVLTVAKQGRPDSEVMHSLEQHRTDQLHEVTGIFSHSTALPSDNTNSVSVQFHKPLFQVTKQDFEGVNEVARGKVLTYVVVVLIAVGLVWLGGLRDRRQARQAASSQEVNGDSTNA